MAPREPVASSPPSCPMVRKRSVGQSAVGRNQCKPVIGCWIALLPSRAASRGRYFGARTELEQMEKIGGFFFSCTTCVWITIWRLFFWYGPTPLPHTSTNYHYHNVVCLPAEKPTTSSLRFGSSLNLTFFVCLFSTLLLSPSTFSIMLWKYNFRERPTQTRNEKALILYSYFQVFFPTEHSSNIRTRRSTFLNNIGLAARRAMRFWNTKMFFQVLKWSFHFRLKAAVLAAGWLEFRLKRRSRKLFGIQNYMISHRRKSGKFRLECL